jgi:phosphatidyl-myo-inositol dimannoside synthase
VSSPDPRLPSSQMMDDVTAELRADYSISEVLLLAPSSGLGGGIERYVETVEYAFRTRQVKAHRINLERPGYRGHLKMLKDGRAALEGIRGPLRIVVSHRALLPVATLLARQKLVRGVSVVCHGSEVWDSRWRPRRIIERQLMRRAGVRVVAVSSFTAGSMASDCQATVLSPGLSLEWFEILASATQAPREDKGQFSVVTVFRLASWREKGLPELVNALMALGRKDVRLDICGSGEPPADLLRFLANYQWCVLRHNMTDRELAWQLSSADLFVLATRTRSGRKASGEGFGMVIMEAQVAGIPVVVPAYGGSSDAYIDGVTGIAPSEETTLALSRTLAEMLADKSRLAWMSERAGEWARLAFAPERYAEVACRRLL